MSGNGLSLVYLIAVALLFLPMMFFVMRQPGALRNLALWVLAFAMLMWGYHFAVEVPQQKALEAQQGTSSDQKESDPASPESLTPRSSDSPVRNL